MKFNRNMLENKWIYYTIATCSAVLLYMGLSHIGMIWVGISKIFSVIYPLFIGMIIAFILSPVVEFFQNNVFHKMKSKKMARNLSIFSTIAVVIAFIAILMVALIPQLVTSITGLLSNLDVYARSLQRMIFKLSNAAAENDIDLSGLNNLSDKFLSMLTSTIPANMEGIITTSFNIGMTIFNYVIGMIMATYFLADSERLTGGFKNLMELILPHSQYRTAGDFFVRCNKILLRFIGFDILDGLIVGIANMIFMGILQMPYMALISVVVGVTNLAPTFGPMVGGVIGVCILLLVNPWYALWFLIFTLVLQTIDGYVIKPKLFGDSLGVPAVWILIAIVVGGRMLGIAGILLSIPVAAILDFLYHDLLRYYGLHKEEGITKEAEASAEALPHDEQE